MLRKSLSAILAALFCAHTVLLSFPARAELAKRSKADDSASYALANEATGILDAGNRHVLLAGLNVFLRDDYSASLPTLVRATCMSQAETPALAIDAATYGTQARLLNLTRQVGHECASYQIAATAVGATVMGGGAAAILAGAGQSAPQGIAVSVHHAGPPPAEIRKNEPAVFVFNPVHGNWTEAKPFVSATHEQQRAYATLEEQRQRIIVGVIALPDALQGEPTRNSSSSLTKPLESVNPADGYLAIDRVEPDNKGAYSVSLPLLLRPSRGPGPSFSVRYSSQGAPGVLGRGWDLFVSSIEVRGPAPIYHPNYETEDYLLDGMDLVAVDGKGNDIPPLYKGGPIIPRVTEGVRVFRLRNNSAGLIIRRYGKDPSDYFWEVWDPNSQVTKLYGGEFADNKSQPRRSSGNGLLRGTVKFGDGARRNVIGQWGLTQEYDRQPARNGATYTYREQETPDCKGWTDECQAALRLDWVEYNRAFAAPGPIVQTGITKVKFWWEDRDPKRFNTDGRLGFFRAYEYWLKRIDVLYEPDQNKLWLASVARNEKPPHANGLVLFARHTFDPEGNESENNPCMNYDRVLKTYKVEASKIYERGVDENAPGELALEAQTFSFDYEGERFKSDGEGKCAREWANELINQAGNVPEEAPGGDWNASKLLKDLGLDLLTSRSLLGTARSTETGASLYFGIGLAGDTSSKQLTGGYKGGDNFSKSEGQSTLIDITGDGIDDILYRDDNGLAYCPGVRDPGTHVISYPSGRCGRVEGIADFSTSSTSTSSSAAEFYGPPGVFYGVGFNGSNNNTYVYFTDRDGDGLPDLVSYGRVYYGLGEDKLNKVVRFAPKSGLTPPIPGIVAPASPLIVGPPSYESKKDFAEKKSSLGTQFPASMLTTVKDIEARLQAFSRRLHKLTYSQTTIAWEAPLNGLVTIAGVMPRGSSDLKGSGVEALAKFGPKQFEALYDEVNNYQKNYIDARFDCVIWGELHCYEPISDPFEPHYVTPKPPPIEFLKTPKARLQIARFRRGDPAVVECFNSIQEAVKDLAELELEPSCNQTGGGSIKSKMIQVNAGDVLYITYSVHPHMAEWMKPSITIAYADVEDDPVFKLLKSEETKGIVDAIPCKWKEQTRSGIDDECLLAKQTRYTYDLRTAALTSAPSESVELPAGAARTFRGRLEIPAELTKDYKLLFEVVAEPTPERAVASLSADPSGAAMYNVPTSSLRRLFWQDISEECKDAVDTCVVDIAPKCDASRADECNLFFIDMYRPYRAASRIAAQHKSAPLPARNISSRLRDVVWRTPPHVRSVFTEKTVSGNPPGATGLVPVKSVDQTMVILLPVAMGDPDVEYFRVEQGSFANPDNSLNEGDPTPRTIDFAQIVSAEVDNVGLARTRQTIALCRLAEDLLRFLEAGYTPYDEPFAEEYTNYWRDKLKPYELRCKAAEAFLKSKKFTNGDRPDVAGAHMLRLPWFLRDLSHAEQVTSAETLLERVLSNLALGEELLTDNPQMTRRGYRLPVKVNPLDCKVLAKGKPLENPVLTPDEECSYRISSNFAMQQLDDLKIDVPGLTDAAISRIRTTLAQFAGSEKAAFTLVMTATKNGRPVAFRELTGEDTGNQDCEHTTPKTCIGTFGTIEPESAYYHPLNGTPGAHSHGDLFQRIATNKRIGRAVAFSNNILAIKDLTRCRRSYPPYRTLGRMESKQDCIFDGSGVGEDDKYTGTTTYAVKYEIRENNQFIGRNRVFEFDASPLDVLEVRFRLAGEENEVARSSPKPPIHGRFSIFDGVATPQNNIENEQYLIPRSPSQILPGGDVKLDCLPIGNPLLSGCRPWTRLGWTEVLLGAQYRTYSDAQRAHNVEGDTYSIKRRRELLRLQPEIEVAADGYVLEHERPNLPAVSQRPDLERYAFYSRDPNVVKTGGDWSLFASKADPEGLLVRPPPFLTMPFVNPIPPVDQSLRYGRTPSSQEGQPIDQAYNNARAACAETGDLTGYHKNCETNLAKTGDNVLNLKNIAFFALSHRFVGPATARAFEDARALDSTRPPVGACAAESPLIVASCWKGVDDTVFLEQAIVADGPVPETPLYSVSALVGFERPPLVRFDDEFTSYKKLICRDPEFPVALANGVANDPKEDVKLHCVGPPAAAGPAAVPAGGGGVMPGNGEMAFPNRPTPPKSDQTVEVFGPVQSSTSSSVSQNEGALLVNKSSIHAMTQTTRLFRDVNGDGFPDVIADNVVELTSPVGLPRRDWWQYFRVREDLPAVNFPAGGGGFEQSAISRSKGDGIGLSASTAAIFLPKGSKSNGTGSSDPNVDPGFELNIEHGYDETFTELRDFNGDGIADGIVGSTVDQGLGVRFNAGNTLRGTSGPLKVEGADVSPFHFNTHHSAGFGIRLGFSYGANSFATGMGLAHRDTGSQAALMDFTGDGRPDIVLPVDEKGTLMVYPNLGNGFGKPRLHKMQNWAITPPAKTESGTALSEATLVDAGAMSTFGFNVWLIRFVFNPGIKWAENQTRELLSLRDLNGDGVPDLVAVGGAFLPGQSASTVAQVHYNPDGKYHLLAEIKNPSGSKWVLHHGLYGNSGPEHGRAVWALTGAARYDGFEAALKGLPADGQDVLFTTYAYENGYFNRAERQFYGFARRTSTVYGCDLLTDDGKSINNCLSVVRGEVDLDWATLRNAGYRKLQVVSQTFSNQDYLTQGIELSRVISGVTSSAFAQNSTVPEPSGHAVSRNIFRYSIDNISPLTGRVAGQCRASHAAASDVSWGRSTFTPDQSTLSDAADGTKFIPNEKVFNATGLCVTDLKQCPKLLQERTCDDGFVLEQRAFWALRTGSVRQRLVTLENFADDVPAITKENEPGDDVPRLRSAVAFDHDQWGQILGFNSIGEADREWHPAAAASTHTAVDYPKLQALNAAPLTGETDPSNWKGYPMLGFAERVQVFANWLGAEGPEPPLRAREAIYAGDGTANLTDVCLYPGGAGFTFTLQMCGKFKQNLRDAVANGYSSMQTAVRLAYEATTGLPKGESSFNAIIHHQAIKYDAFGNLLHAISPLSQNKEWIERRFDYANDPFRRTAASTMLTRCVTDIPGAGSDTPSLAKQNKPRCTFGFEELPTPVLRRPITHASRSRIDTHFGLVAETQDINDNRLLFDFDRWGRLSLLARAWGNAPRENKTFSSQLKRALAKDPANVFRPETVSEAELNNWRLLAIADYEQVSDGVLRSNLRKFESADSYSGLLAKDQTTREIAAFADGLGRTIQTVREADVCTGVRDEFINSQKNGPSSAGLAERCDGIATGIVSPMSRIDGLGRDLQMYEAYPTRLSAPREGSDRRLVELTAPTADPRPLASTTYDGAGRPLLVESRLSDPAIAGAVRAASQYRYAIVPENGSRLARFEALTLSPRCTASAVWSDARGLKTTVFENQKDFYSSEIAPGIESLLGADSYRRDYGKTRPACDPITGLPADWALAAKDSGQPMRVSYTYDPLQQLTAVEYPLDGAARTGISVRFDQLGRTIEVQEPNSGCTRYAYDDLNSLLSETSYRHEGSGDRACGTTSKVRNEKAYTYSGGRLVRMAYHSLEEQSGAPDERDTVRFYYDRSPSAILFGHVLETLRFVPNDQANQRFADVAGRKCDNCIGQASVISDRTGARSLSFNELGQPSREVRSIVAPLEKVEHSRGLSETYMPEVAFYELETSYTAFGDPVQEKFSESAPMNPASTCVPAGVNTCLSRFSIGRHYAPDGAIAQLTFNGKPLINAAQDALGRPAVRWTSNGIATGYRYGSEDLRLNQMSTLTAAATKDGKNVPVQVNGYQYDGAGNILSYANASANNFPNDYVSRFGFGYDAVNRLVGFKASVQKGKEYLDSDGNYTYDSGHRFRDRSLNISANAGSSLNRSWTYRYGAEPTEGPLHAPQSIDFKVGETKRTSTFGYDDLGRMTRIGISEQDKLKDQEKHIPLLSNRAMTWDGEGRLLRVRGVKDAAIDGNETLLWEDYLYDSGGNRTVKIYPWSQEKDHGQKDDREAAALYLTPFYSRPYDRRGTVQLSQGTLPVASLVASADPSEDPVVTYLYSDLPVGSMTAAVTVLGEATDGKATVIARREYSPFGLELTADDLANTGRGGIVSVFHGKELDRITNLSSFGARYYSRDLGIWLKPDPALSSYLRGGPNGGVYSSQNLHQYSFGYQNPNLFRDKDGYNPGICYSGLTQVFSCVDFQSGNRIVDDTLLGVVNQTLNIVPSVGNTVTDALAGVGQLLEPYENQINALAAFPEFGPALQSGGQGLRYLSFLARSRFAASVSSVLRTGVTVDELVGGAQSALARPALARQLRLEAARSAFTAEGKLAQEALAGAKEIIPGSQIRNPNVPRGFSKFSTRTYQGPSGDFQVHFYMDPKTMKPFYGLDYKTIFNEAP